MQSTTSAAGLVFVPLGSCCGRIIKTTTSLQLSATADAQSIRRPGHSETSTLSLLQPSSTLATIVIDRPSFSFFCRLPSPSPSPSFALAAFRQPLVPAPLLAYLQ